MITSLALSHGTLYMFLLDFEMIQDNYFNGGEKFGTLVCRLRRYMIIHTHFHYSTLLLACSQQLL